MDKKNRTIEQPGIELSPENVKRLEQLRMTPEEWQESARPYSVLKVAVPAFRKETVRNFIDEPTRLFNELAESEPDAPKDAIAEQMAALRGEKTEIFNAYLGGLEDEEKAGLLDRLKSPEYIYSAVFTSKPEWGGALSDGIEFALTSLDSTAEKQRYAMFAMTIADTARLHCELLRACNPEQGDYSTQPLIKTRVSADISIAAARGQIVGLNSIDKNQKNILNSLKAISQGKRSVSESEYEDIPSGCSFLVADTIVFRNRQRDHLENALLYLEPRNIQAAEVQGIIDALPTLKEKHPEILEAVEALEAYKSCLPYDDNSPAIDILHPETAPAVDAEPEESTPIAEAAPETKQSVPAGPTAAEARRLAALALAEKTKKEKAAKALNRQNRQQAEKKKRQAGKEKAKAQEARREERRLAEQEQARIKQESIEWMDEQLAPFPYPELPEVAKNAAERRQADHLVSALQGSKAMHDEVRHIEGQPWFNPTPERMIELHFCGQEPTPIEQAAMDHDHKIWQRQRQIVGKVAAEIDAAIQQFDAEQEANEMAAWEEIMSAAANLEFKTGKGDEGDSTSMRRKNNHQYAHRRQKVGLRPY
jgi:hypothetical protein